MLLAGQIVFYIGLFLTITGLVGGFGLMFAGIEPSWAKFFFMTVPLGFLFVFAGLSTNVLLESRESDKS